MKAITLNLDDLEVDTFVTTPSNPDGEQALKALLEGREEQQARDSLPGTLPVLCTWICCGTSAIECL